MSGHPFWSDDFDMDLPKVIPGARAALGDVGDLEMVTHGHATLGRLNHPSVWNDYGGMVAFFGRTAPGKPDAFWTDDPIVRCTLWEAIRDVWAHDFVLIFEGVPVWRHPGMFNGHFYPLMAHLRGWRLLPEAAVDKHRAYVLEAIGETADTIRTQIAGAVPNTGEGGADNGPL